MRIVDGIVDYARIKDHPASLVYALFHAVPIALYAGELTTAGQFVKLMIDLAMKHALERWNAWGQCFEGVLLIKRGDSGAGSRLLRAGLEGVPEAFHYHTNLFLAELAEGLSGAGHLAEGFVVMERALARAKRIEEGWCFAELLRKSGEPCPALPSAGPDHPGAQGVGPRLPAVHRRVHDRRSASRERTPRCASLVAELLQALERDRRPVASAGQARRRSCSGDNVDRATPITGWQLG